MIEKLVTSSIIIIVIIAIRMILRGKISSRAIYALWIIAAIRLIIPSGIAKSPVSIMNTVDNYIISKESERPVYINTDNISINNNDLSDEKIDNPIRDINSDKNTFLDAFPKISAVVSILTVIWFTAANIKFYIKLRRSRKRLDHDAPLKIYLSDEISTPCIFGIIKPAIYVTKEAAQNKKYLYYIVMHEMCHYYHGDLFWSLLRYVLLSAFWFDPFVWAAVVLSKRDCECACDEAVIKRTGNENRLEYGRTLIEMIPRRNTVMFGVASTSMSAAGNILKSRITLISMEKKHSISAFVLTLCAAVLTAAVTFTSAETIIIPNSDSEDNHDKKTEIYVEKSEEKEYLTNIIARSKDYSGKEVNICFLVSPDVERESYIYITEPENVYIPAVNNNTPFSEKEYDFSELKTFLEKSHFSKAELTYYGENILSKTFTASASYAELSKLTEMLKYIKPVYAEEICSTDRYITISFSRENGGFSSFLEIELSKIGDKTYGKITADDFSDLLDIIRTDSVPSESELSEAYMQSIHSVSGYFCADDTELLEFCEEYLGNPDITFGTDLFSDGISENFVITGKYPIGYKEKIIGDIALGIPSNGSAQVIGPLMLWQKDDMSLKVIMGEEKYQHPNGTFCGLDAYFSENTEKGKFISELYIYDSKKSWYKIVFEANDCDESRQTAATILGTIHLNE